MLQDHRLSAGRYVTGIYEYGCDLFRKRMECALMVAVAREIKAAESDEANAPA